MLECVELLTYNTHMISWEKIRVKKFIYLDLGGYSCASRLDE